MPEGWTSVHLDAIEPIPVVGGTLMWRPLRRTLDIGAFGINAYVAPKAGDDVVEEHSESSLGHEEVYLVLSGRATFSVGGERVDAPAGTAVFIRDPELVRQARAEEDGTTVLAIGGKRGEGYEVSAWEDVFAAEKHRAANDYDAMVDELEQALARRPDHPRLLYGLAAAEALAGRSDEALEHLRHALELRPDWEPYLREDEDLASLRDDPRWPFSS